MRKRLWVIIGVLLGVCSLLTPAYAGDHRLGIGVQYWNAVNEIDVSHIDKDGYAMVVSYQYKPSLFGLQLDVEVADEQLTGQGNTVYSPQAFVIAGGFIYGGLGIGTHYSDGDFAKDPFYALKAGLDFEPLPHIHLDVNANYRFDNWDMGKVKEDIDADTMTLGAVARIEF